MSLGCLLIHRYVVENVAQAFLPSFLLLATLCLDPCQTEIACSALHEFRFEKPTIFYGLTLEDRMKKGKLDKLIANLRLIFKV